MADLVTLGELLVDFISLEPGRPAGQSEKWTAAPGGAPANVAVAASRLGVSTAFLGKVGDDPFGHMLARTLAAEGIDTSGLLFDRSARTALAFVSLSASGERSFHFYRHPSADMLYRPEEVDLAAVRAASLLHFGSISLIGEPSRSATRAAIEAARGSGALVSFDPNLRLDLWTGATEAKRAILEAFESADVVKLSEEELEFLTGSRSLDSARELARGLRLLVVTRGAGGADYLSPVDSGRVAGFETSVVDTTGAGDSFMGGLLAGLAADRTLPRRSGQLREVLRRANACAAMSVAAHGAIPALPRIEHLEEFLARTSPSK